MVTTHQSTSQRYGARVAPGAGAKVVGQEWHRLHNAVCAFLSCLARKSVSF